MSRKNNLKDGFKAALRDGATGEQTRVAVDLEGAAIQVPGGINVQLDHDGANPDSVQIGDGTNIGQFNSEGSLSVTTKNQDPSGDSQIPKSSGVDTSNSTNVALGSGATYTGAFKDASGFSNIVVTINTDEDSAADGLIIEWSTDGVNVDNTDEYTISANSGKTISAGIITKYYRIKYINGTSAQGHLRLQTILHTDRQKPSVHRIADTISPESDAELVKAVLTGLDEDTETFTNVSTREGSLKVSSSGTLQIDSVVYDDMGTAVGGIARETNVDDSAFVDVYNVSGSGLLFGFMVTLENMKDKWNIQFIVDGNEIFPNGDGFLTTDFSDPDTYGFDENPNLRSHLFGGIELYKNTFRWNAPDGLPIEYKTDIVIQIKREDGQGDAKFLAGLVFRTE